MTNELAKLAFVIFLLAIGGSVFGIIFSPVSGFAFAISSLVSILTECFFILAIGIVLIAIGSFYFVSHVIKKLSTYNKFTSINPDINIARRQNFISIFFWNCIFGVILFLTVIFIINSLYPLNNSNTPNDIDYAFVTALIVVPGFLISLRLLTNPVKIKPRFPMMFVLATPNENEDYVKNLKERTVSFYHSFIQVPLYTIIILYSYLALKGANDPSKFFSEILPKITPTYPLNTLIVFILAFFIDIFFISFVSEFLLERYDVFIQNDKIE